MNDIRKVRLFCRRRATSTSNAGRLRCRRRVERDRGARARPGARSRGMGDGCAAGSGASAGCDRPQIGTYDVFVGVMWRRYGTPTGDAESGTEEEFLDAYSGARARLPKLMFYFCDAPPPEPAPSDAALQFERVERFRRRLESDLPLLYHRYSARERFDGPPASPLPVARRGVQCRAAPRPPRTRRARPAERTERAARYAVPDSELHARTPADQRRVRRAQLRQRPAGPRLRASAALWDYVVSDAAKAAGRVLRLSVE